MTAPMTREELLALLRKHIQLDWLNASDGHPDVVGLGAAADAILDHGNAQQPGPALLWCCHVRGPDDVYAAPDYETALAWSDILNEMNWRSGAYPKPLGFQNPASYADCLVKATPAPWPYSAEAHAEDLPKSIAGFAPSLQPGSLQMTPSTRAPKCKADFYALWCDNCNLHPVNCPLRSTPAPTDAGALAATRLAAADAIRTFCKSLGVGAVAISSDGVERIYYAGISLDALSVAVTTALRNSAPQETRGDEPTDEWCNAFLKSMGQWVEPHEPEKECGVAIECGITQEDADSINAEFRAAVREALTDAGSLAASQQSPRLEREGIAQIVDPRAFIIPDSKRFDIKARQREAFDKADAILALLSPDTSLESSPEREPGPMVPWELDCRRAVCAAPECECPAVSSTGQVWQPADTAPQDGSTIEVRFLTDNPRRVRWSQSDRGTYWHLADSNGPAIINFNPTEWRPVSSNHPREVE